MPEPLLLLLYYVLEVGTLGGQLHVVHLGSTVDDLHRLGVASLGNQPAGRLRY